jgi:hypothetical protein
MNSRASTLSVTKRRAAIERVGLHRQRLRSCDGNSRTQTVDGSSARAFQESGSKPLYGPVHKAFESLAPAKQTTWRASSSRG